ncbi:MAG: hypothetical protein ABIQ56_03760 [Chitinophagaceae bacterium]
MKKYISAFVTLLIVSPAFSKDSEPFFEGSTATVAGKVIGVILFILFILYLVRRGIGKKTHR